MVESIEPVTGIKRKRDAFVPQISSPEPQIIWPGQLTSSHFVNVVFESGNRVSDVAVRNTREVREDHDRETNRRHTERFWESFQWLSMQRNHLKRDFVNIPSA